jgi:hypothetical protein
MRPKSTCLTVLLATTSAALSLALVVLDAQAFELRGFRGVHWGEGADALRGVTLMQRDGDVDCRQRETENLIFGDTHLTGVHYCFHRDRLVMVVLDAPVKRSTFSTEFQQTYGRPDAQLDGADTWGDASSTTRARLVALGPARSRLMLSVNRVPPDVLRRLVRLATAEPRNAQRMAAAD